MKKTTLVCILLFGFLNHHFAQLVPNGDFEMWSSPSYTNLDKWSTSNPYATYLFGTYNVTKVSSAQSGAAAIKLETVAGSNDTIIAHIANTPGSILDYEGGTPFSQRPMNVKGYYKSKILSGDSAIIMVGFKKGGVPIGGFDIFKIGGSVNTYTPFTFPITPLTEDPDSLLFCVFSSNPFDMANVKNESWIILDSLSFSSDSITITDNVPNAAFESWIVKSTNEPDYWTSSNIVTNQPSADRVMDGHSGLYALKLTTQAQYGGKAGYVMLGSSDWENDVQKISPGMALISNPDTMHFWYKFIPDGNQKDTAFALVYCTKKVGNKRDSIVSQGSITLLPSINYVHAKMKIWHESPITPDSATILFFTSVNLDTANVNIGTELHIDNISFDQTLITSHKLSLLESRQLMIFPNPVRDVINFYLPVGISFVQVYDVTGKTVQTIYANGNKNLQVKAEFPSGVYFYKGFLEDGSNTSIGRFVKVE